MTKATATATVETKSYEPQEPYDRTGSGYALARAGGVDRYQGDVEAEVTWQGVSAAAADGSASFVGIAHVTGTVHGRDGTFLLQFASSGPDTAAVTVMPGSATGGLAGLRGTGTLAAGAPPWTLTLDYEL